jgi:hypothetical protein
MHPRSFLGLCAIAILLANLGLATAQPEPGGTSPPASGDQNKCWDEATKQIRDKISGIAPGSTTTSGPTRPNVGSATEGADTRPPEATGLPKC